MPKSLASEHTALDGHRYFILGEDNVEWLEFHVNDVPDELASIL